MCFFLFPEGFITGILRYARQALFQALFRRGPDLSLNVSKNVSI